MRKTGNKGFTLIELLVVIAIIGILSSVVLASLNTARLKSRDAKRISDVKQLQLALEFYFDSNGGYPSAISGTLLTEPGFIAVIPTPPTGVAGETAYKYAALNAGCTSYHIGTVLEDAGHTALQSKVGSKDGTTGTDCPDEANSDADFDGTVTAIYDLKP